MKLAQPLVLMKINISEKFYSIQGEGRTMGRPAFFIRLSGCNLLCGGMGTEKDQQLHNGATWRCDTIEVWRKGTSYDTRALYDILCKQFNYDELVRKGVHTIITGGEPLLQQKAVLEFVHIVKGHARRDAIFEIETNGTVMPSLELSNQVKYYNVSPKLVNSGMPSDKRMKSEVLAHFNEKSQTIFKFVVSNDSDIQEVIHLVDIFNLYRHRIWLMPAASDIPSLAINGEFVAKACIDNQFNYSHRLQVAIWDKTTGV